MARVVCQVIHRPERVSVLWSEGAASFEPYHLEGPALARFNDVARQARESLAGAVASPSPQAAAALATLGEQLYRLLFQLDGPPSPAAGAVHDWWQELRRRDAVQSFEIASDVPGRVPWNAVYDQPVEAGAFGAGPGSPAWQRFWGFQFALGVGRRVNPLRAFPYLDQPALLVALDTVLETRLAGEQRQQLEQLVAERGGELVRSLDELLQRLRQSAPDVLAVISRIDRGDIVLGDRAGSLRELRQALADAEAGNPQPVVLLLGSPKDFRSPEDFGTLTGSWECFLASATSELSSVVAPEVPGPAASNVAAGLAWLAKFLSAEADAGAALQQARQAGGLAGLAYSAFCPPHVRVLAEGKEPDADLPGPTLYDLPSRPYRGLAPFDREDRALFLGREDDTIRFARLLDESWTRGMFLHGAAGAGKASFLRAGVVPYLEDEALGYFILRDRSDTAQTQAERDRPTLSIRAGGDLAGQLAAALGAFCAQPFTYATPAEGSVTVDLPGILSQYARGTVPAPSDAIQATAPAGSGSGSTQSASTAVAVDPPGVAAPPQAAGQQSPVLQLYEAICDDPAVLGRLLDDIAARLPFELVIVIEQGEDLVTQATGASASQRRQASFRALAGLAATPARCKAILSLRTEFFGQLGEALALGKDRGAWRDFLLAPLSAKALTDAILLPTAVEPPPYAKVAPHQHYRLSFESGVVSTIVAHAVGLAPECQCSAAAIAQAACAYLATSARERNEPLIKMDHLRPLRVDRRGRIELTLDRYVEQQLRDLPVSRAGQKSLRFLMTRMHRRQPDGSVVRPLHPARDLAQHWRAAEPVQQAVSAAAKADMPLLDVQQQLVDGREGLYVGLAHDALAAWAVRHTADVERNRFARAKVIDVLYILVPLIALAAALSYFLTRQYFSGAAGAAEDPEKLAERFKALVEQYKTESLGAVVPLYDGALAQAEQALQTGNLLRARQHLLALQPGSDKPFKDRRDDRRGFDWYYLWRRANPERHTLLGHRGLVNAVAASRDSALLATAGADGTVRLWNLKRNGEVAAILSGHKGAVLAVAFAPDGKTLASAGADTTVRLWDVKIGIEEPAKIDAPSKILAGHGGTVHALTYGADASTLISGGADKAVIVWDVAAGKARATLKEHGEPIEAVAFAPGGKSFVSAAKDGVLVWDAGGKKTQTLKVPGAVVGLAITGDGVLATAGNELQAGNEVGAVRVWDLKAGKELGSPIHVAGGLFGVAFQPNSKSVLVTAGKDHALRAYDYKTGKELQVWRGHFGWVRAVAVTPDGAAVAASSYDNTVKVWDWNPPVESLRHGAGVQALAFSRDDELLASGGKDGVVKLWRMSTGALLGEIKGHPGAITGLAFLPDNKDRKLVVGSWSDDGAGGLKLWSLTVAEDKVNARDAPAFKDAAKRVQCLALGQNGMLATGHADGTAILWDAAAGAKKHTLEVDLPVHSLALSPSGGRLATGDRAGKVRLWETAGGTLLARGNIKEVGAHTAAVQAILFLHEDFEFVSAGADHMVKHWSWKPDEDPVGGLVSRAHHQPVHCLAAIPGGSFASGASDRAVKLWDIRDAGGGEERLTLAGHAGAVQALAATAKGQLLASGGGDGVIRLWRASPPMTGR
ncbi:MAG: hypothetical protein L0Y71_20400 [Gemmataceae bacterium]|nr:hypothetical protein [Gemmataceae bacterium]